MGGSMHIFSKEHVLLVVTEWGTDPSRSRISFADKYFETGGVTMTMEMHWFIT
jgi:hypothetical protein